MAALLGLRAIFSDIAQGEVTRLRLLQRIEEAQLVIAATSAELECEAERAHYASDHVANVKSKATQALTVGSMYSMRRMRL